jgi:hypothetical protein
MVMVNAFALNLTLVLIAKNVKLALKLPHKIIQMKEKRTQFANLIMIMLQTLFATPMERQNLLEDGHLSSMLLVIVMKVTVVDIVTTAEIQDMLSQTA